LNGDDAGNGAGDDADPRAEPSGGPTDAAIRAGPTALARPGAAGSTGGLAPPGPATGACGGGSGSGSIGSTMGPRGGRSAAGIAGEIEPGALAKRDSAPGPARITSIMASDPTIAAPVTTATIGHAWRRGAVELAAALANDPDGVARGSGVAGVASDAGAAGAVGGPSGGAGSARPDEVA
jgi:hypothetical protein